MLEGEQVSERPWFIEGQQRLYLGDVHAAVRLAPLLGPHPAGQEWRFVDIAIPLLDTGGEPIGVLGAHLSWEWARGVEHTVLTTARRLAGVEIFIVNASGEIIMAPRGNNDPRLPPLARLNEASDQVTWPDGLDYLTAIRTSSGYRDYPGLGWKVITRQPVEKAFASVRLLQMYIAGAGIVMAVVFGLLGLLLAHFLSRPLAELARRADQIRQGRTDLQLPAGGVFRETRQLSASFGELLKELRRHEDELARFNASLEQQVADRTEAVDVANRHLMSLLEERGELMQKLEALAATDSLTGLLNRRAFDEKAATEDRRAQRQHTPISVLTFDIDHFKHVNDNYGHDTGDEALRQCAAACGQQLREIDLFARFGGEEFVILLPETEVPGAELLAERLRLTIAGLRIETAQGILQFTASFGIAPHVPGQDIATALQQADQALYAAKHSGRNRVVVYF
jgi:diguanylate cyclase